MYVINKNWILSDLTPIEIAEDYGDFKIHDAGHFKFWEKITAQYPRLRKYDYGHYPRGRAVYDAKKRQFYVYLDKCIIHDPELVEKIVKTKLNLVTVSYKILTDSHYKCKKCE